MDFVTSHFGAIAIANPPKSDDKYVEKSVQLVRGSFSRNDLLHNPYFRLRKLFKGGNYSRKYGILKVFSYIVVNLWHNCNVIYTRYVMLHNTASSWLVFTQCNLYYWLLVINGQKCKRNF